MESFRAVLEMLKWADYQDTLLSASVSSVFLKACESSELWIHFCECRRMSSSPAPGTSYKEHFRTHRFDSANCYFLSAETQSVYNFSTQSWKLLPFISLSGAYWNCSYVLTTAGILICGGGAVNTNKAWLYSPNEGHLSELPSMNSIRAGHGCVNDNNIVYVFGGAGDRDTCEKFTTSQWILMAPMVYEHAWFTPAVHSSLIYLCGGGVSQCEVFDTLTEQCSSIPITLPTTSEACAFACDKGIIVIQRGYVAKVNDGKITVQQIEFSDSPWGNSSPLVVGNTAYIPRIDQHCLRKIVVKDTTEVEEVTAPQGG